MANDHEELASGGGRADAPAKAATGAGDRQGLEIFRRALLESAGPDTRATIGDEELSRQTDASFAMLARKTPGRHRIGWRQSQLAMPDGTVDVSILEILNDDMPFLVASVVGEVQARGLGIRLVVHPIVKTERRRDGSLARVTGPGDRFWDDGSQESYIAVFVDSFDPQARDSLKDAVSAILDQVRVVVQDWRAMLARIEQAISHLRASTFEAPGEVLAESVAFLEWLRDGQFTFLGMRDYALAGRPAALELTAVEGGGLGVLRDPGTQVLRRGGELVAMTPEVQRFFLEPDPLIITKSNVLSRVHRRVHMDYIGVKLYGREGRPSGELRIVGLLTSSAYTQSPRQIPILRHKVDEVLARSGALPESHDGKALLNVLETFPRDELFQIGIEDLSRWSAGILDLEARPRVRVFVRIDQFDRFVSILAYVPRDRFSTSVRERLQELLTDRYRGHIAAFYPRFTDGPLVRVHFIVGRREGPTPVVSVPVLEREIASLIQTWDDRLTQILVRGEARDLMRRYVGAFPGAYAERFSPERAVEDISRIERLIAERPVAVDLYAGPVSGKTELRCAIYRLGGPIRLSERVPVLENLGFAVIDERTYRIGPKSADGARQEVVLHDMVLEVAGPWQLDPERDGPRIEDCFLAVGQGLTENDSFNRLIIAAGLAWREAAVIRAYAAYLRQLGSAFGLRYIADTVVAHADLARDLVALFAARFHPDGDDVGRRAREEAVLVRLDAALAAVQSLDEDRILRQLLGLVVATMRTNFYQRGTAGQLPETIAFKFSGRDLSIAPEPKTFREIWVWSPRVEGVHLRFAPTARGGIRWSDRPQDFRTEVLALAKAQQVKNAVIVPAGAKGGFYPKQLPKEGGREAIQKEGVAAYTTFVKAMLALTDNIVEGRVVPPDRVVRHDADDPYLVVAADKGTATFSDTANSLSLAHGFWLGDAFASGGSAGYDHRRMGITSRGAWECIKRHFREVDRDIQSEPFRVAGVGDMSGDVFGNGMLLSRQTRLVAAFDHRDIFLDPTPDAEATWTERKRLFDLPRSSWQDFDRSRLSKGGGIFPRTLKSIDVSDEVRAMLGIEARAVTPAELVRAILTMETDLLFFGGIGTFVRASTESDGDVGDRNNDAVRVAAAEIRAKVIGEGANLGMTQRARVEFASRGGRINTDFIDNSAGVNTSDQEVNIKIALGPAVRGGRLPIEERNALLAEMTPDVTRAVLRNNYQQSLALSLAECGGAHETIAYARLIRSLSQRGLLDRRLEYLPSDAEISERQKAGRGFTRPELAVLSSYAKIALLHDLLGSKVPDHPAMRFLLADYFPPAVQTRFGSEIEAHPLAREIIATTLTNGLVNRLGAPAPLSLADATARPATETAYAFIVARAVFGLPDLWLRIDGLDGKLQGTVQLELYSAVRRLLLGAVGFYLREGTAARNPDDIIARHRTAWLEMASGLAAVVPARASLRTHEVRTSFAQAGVPEELATDIAALEVLAALPAVAEIARSAGRDVIMAAKAYLLIGERFGLDRIAEGARSLGSGDEYERIAVAGAEAAIAAAHRRITLTALASGLSAEQGLDGFVAADRHRIERTMREINGIAEAGALSLARLTVAAARLTDIAGGATSAS